MQPEEYNNLMEVLNLMIECELVVGDFYGKCSQVFEKNMVFWDNLAKEEPQYANKIAQIGEMVKKTPNGFTLENRLHTRP